MRLWITSQQAVGPAQLFLRVALRRKEFDADLPEPNLRDRTSRRRDKHMRMTTSFIIHYWRWQPFKGERNWTQASYTSGNLTQTALRRLPALRETEQQAVLSRANYRVHLPGPTRFPRLFASMPALRARSRCRTAKNNRERARHRRVRQFVVNAVAVTDRCGMHLELPAGFHCRSLPRSSGGRARRACCRI
jgi:hypothetical protein